MIDCSDIHERLRQMFPDATDMSDANLIHSYGLASQALFYSILFVPQLLEIHGSVLLRWNLPNDEERQRFLTLREKVNTEPEREQLEATFNFVEIGYLFDATRRDTGDDEDAMLARQLEIAWTGVLAVQFPERRFIIDVLSCHQTGSTVGIQFYERK